MVLLNAVEAMHFMLNIAVEACLVAAAAAAAAAVDAPQPGFERTQVFSACSWLARCPPNRMQQVQQWDTCATR
jgi:hypothetical protein